MSGRCLLILAACSLLSGCFEESCGGGGGGGSGAAMKTGGGFNASNLSAPEPAKLGKPSCPTGTCPFKQGDRAVESASRVVGAAAPERAGGALASLESGASRLARTFDGAGDAPAPAVPASSRPGWVCDGDSCRRVP